MRYLSIVVFGILVNVALGSGVSIGPEGIDSATTNLDGSGVLIGQVESRRSGKAGKDDADHSVPNTVPERVYFITQTSEIGANQGTGLHATQVAQTMIGKDTSGNAYVGVAPNAQLYSFGFGGADEFPGSAASEEEIIYTMNRAATIQNSSIRVINNSWGVGLQTPIQQPDGTHRIAMFLDWSTKRDDVLYVNALPGGFVDPDSTPSDSYNDITVAASDNLSPGLTYRKAWNLNRYEGDAVGDRTSVDLLAPGTNVTLLGFSGQTSVENGTSVAAPHVTGAVALLQQYAQQQIDMNNDRFFGGARRHEVMKAVLLNSADKISGVQGSNRTVVDTADQPWNESEAFGSPFIPLDDEMGAGHLNVRRALRQYRDGEQDLSAPVPHIGWDYSTIGPAGDTGVQYVLNGLESGQYITATLVWDRTVQCSCLSSYETGSMFFNPAVANLSLRLVNRSNDQVVSQSISEDMNLEHIFFQVQDSGDYELRVSHDFGDIGNPGNTNYALAWWYGGGSAPLPGDYDGNGSVGPEDYDIWKANFGTSFAAADGNGNGVVDAADYTVWRDNFGAGSGSVAAVPEPSSAWLVVAAMVAVGWRRVASASCTGV